MRTARSVSVVTAGVKRLEEVLSGVQLKLALLLDWASGREGRTDESKRKNRN